jgi:dGTPase
MGLSLVFWSQKTLNPSPLSTRLESMGKPTPRNHFYNAFDQDTFPVNRAKREGDYRSVFQIDRDRVTYSAPFRRLQSKTQVFQSGEYDFYRTRLTHSIEVAHVGRSLCQHLNHTSPFLQEDFFIDVDLVEGICLAHDLGHPPFGHIGERKLNQLMGPYGGFEGNAQTLRIITDLIYDQGHGVFVGMRPTRAFLDGILKYKALFSEKCVHGSDGQAIHPDHHFIYNSQEPILRFVYGDAMPLIADRQEKSLECQIMDWADDTAYCLHDIIDGARAGFISHQRLEQWGKKNLDSEGKFRGFKMEACLRELIDSVLADNMEWCFAKKIGNFIHACSLKPRSTPNPLKHLTQRYHFEIEVDPKILAECELYKQLTADLIFTSTALQRYEFKGSSLLTQLFEAIEEHYVQKTDGLQILPEATSHAILKGQPSKEERYRRICDFLANLTDRQAIQIYKRLYYPDVGSLTDLG